MPWNGTIWIPYEIINSTNSTSFTDIVRYDSSVTGGAFGIMMLLAFFFVVLIGMYKNDQDIAIQVASLVTTILAFMFAAMGIVGDDIAWACTFLTVASVIILYVTKGGSNG